MSDLPHTPLIEAVKAYALATIDELLESGADVNQQDEHGWTALSWAAGNGDAAIVTRLLENGADVFLSGRDRRTPRQIAWAANHPDVTHALREAEARARGTGSAATALERPYCKAYPVERLQQGPGWPDGATHSEDVAFLHHDFTVTRSFRHDEQVLFDRVTPEWIEFCTRALHFDVQS